MVKKLQAVRSCSIEMSRKEKVVEELRKLAKSYHTRDLMKIAERKLFANGIRYSKAESEVEVEEWELKRILRNFRRSPSQREGHIILDWMIMGWWCEQIDEKKVKVIKRELHF